MPSYFAYGSDLSVGQMARRGPDAADPRPAVLSDYDWVVNERGVATVEPFPASQVHGVLWQVSERDLALLDRAETVAVRRKLTVQCGDEPRAAWVYIDDATEPGAPLPGYLEHVVDAAVQQGLSSSWVESLRRWDPVNWPRELAPTDVPGPQSLSELLAEPGIVEESVLRSRFGFMAFHGGGLEQMTDVISERAAEAAEASLYVVRHPEDYPHHLSSSAFLAEESSCLAEFLDHVDVVVALHGYGRVGRSTELLAGGGNRALAAHIAKHVAIPGYQVVSHLDDIPSELRGLHPDNPVNKARGGGTQLELSPRVRGISPRSGIPGDDGLSPATSTLVHGLAAAARSWPLTSD